MTRSVGPGFLVHLLSPPRADPCPSAARVGVSKGSQAILSGSTPVQRRCQLFSAVRQAVAVSLTIGANVEAK